MKVNESNRPEFIAIVITIIFWIIFVFWGYSLSNPPNYSKILVKNDWCYPSCDDNVLSSFKFSSDGTFTFSTIMFGGMSRRGTWRDLGNGNIQTNDNQVGTQTVIILSRTRIKVGSTTYNRENIISKIF